ncbi:MAG TPA: glycosyl hydrolase family 28-related protein, partial [Pyrinomonadaceae bacterium]|nr:glycosyl hydrolase family 28-related protein [Pyrinomonadaceae bacterium]
MKRRCVCAVVIRAGAARGAWHLMTTVVLVVTALASAGAAQTAGGARRVEPVISDAPVFDVMSFGADANDERDDRAAIQSAINTAEASGGGTVVVSSAGTYNLAARASDAQVLLITRSIKFQCVPGAELLMSVAGANRTHGLRVAPASTAPSYNVLSQLEIEGCRLVPARGSAPGGYGLFFDTSGERTQIRNALVRGTHVGTPGAEFGDYALAMTNPTGAPDTQFTNSFRDIWVYGGIRVDKVGDSLEFESVRVSSNVPDRPSMYVNLVGGATGPNVRGGNMTAGGGIIIASAVNPNFGGGLIVEVGNRSLTTFAATPAVIQVKGGGIVPRVQGAKFEGVSIITLIPGVHGMIVDQADTTVVGTNTWNVSTQGGPGLDPVYQLPNTRPLRLITTARASGTMWHN